MGLSRRLAPALATAAALVGMGMAPAVANQPAFTFEEDVTGETFVCESTTYTLTAGTVKITIHEGESRSGNTNFTITVRPQGAVAEDPEGNVVKIAGAFWAGATSNAQQGTEQFTLTDKFQIIEQGGGTVDSVNVTFHINLVDGVPTNVKDFDLGTCVSPE